MSKKPLLAELIDGAVDDCKIYGEGRREDEENNSGLRVTAEWIDSGDTDAPYIISICIFLNGILKLSYDDPTTKCK